MPQSIARRLNVSIIVTVSVLLLILGIISSLRERSALNTRLLATAATVESRLAQALPGPVWNLDKAQIENVLRGEMGDPEIDALVVAGAKGPIAVMERDQDGKPVVREVPSKLASAIRREVPLAYNDGGAQKDLGKVELYITSRFVNATGAEVRGHVEGTNAEIERSVSANQEQAATVEEIVRTAAELAKVAEGLTANVARYKV